MTMFTILGEFDSSPYEESIKAPEGVSFAMY